jgi:serine protease Do
MKARATTALVFGLVLGLAIGVLGTGIAGSPASTPGGAAIVPASPEVALVQAPITSATFAKLAEAVKPAVINVSTLSRVGGRTSPEEFFGEEYFRRFFGDVPERQPRRGLGSGVIIDANGTALTNAHVVDRASEIEVVLLDGGKHKAKVVGVDKKTDLAVLKLEGSKAFPYLKLADSDDVQVGDWVLAVGSPFGLQATVTSGIVSAKARQIGAGPYDDFLQTDAAINPGNSGGPLVNMRGEVIGINTAIVRGGNGIGFAIPSSIARRVSSELVANGSVTRGWLGVSLQPLTPDLAASFDAKGKTGALVSEVVPDSPAARAGVRSGDIVLGFNGKKIQNAGELARAVGLSKPGQDAKLVVWREGAEKTLDVRLTQTPGETAPARLGLEVRPMTPEVARELGVESPEGVVVSRVEEGSAADDAGIRRGDVIRELDRKAVKTLADFERAAGGLKAGQPATVRLQRGKASLYVALDLAKG